MNSLVINENHNDLTIAGSKNTLDIQIKQHEININQQDVVTVSPVNVGLEVRTDAVTLDIVSQSIALLTVAEQGPMGPAGPAGSGGTATLQTIFDQINDDSGYRGDAALGELTSEATWKIVKIIIQEDGTPMELDADSDTGFVHIWDARASLSY